MCRECVKSFQDCLPEVDSCLKKFSSVYIVWKMQGRDVVYELNTIADELDAVKFNCNIAKLTGASVGVVGAGLTVAGLVLAPFTFGGSTALTVAGISVGVAGGVTTAGTGITEIAINATRRSKVTERLLAHQKLTEALSESLNEIYAQKDKLEKIVTQNCNDFNLLDVKAVASSLLNAGMVGVGTVAFAAQVFRMAKTGLDVSIAVGENALAGASTAAAVTRAFTSIAFQGALVALSVVVDVVTITLTALDVSKGNKSQLALEYRQRAGTLEEKAVAIDSEIGFLAIN